MKPLRLHREISVSMSNLKELGVSVAIMILKFFNNEE